MKKVSTALIIAFIFVISAAPANADSTPPPWSYEIEFEEQDLIFRMNVTDNDIFNPENPACMLNQPEKKFIRYTNIILMNFTFRRTDQALL